MILQILKFLTVEFMNTVILKMRAKMIVSYKPHKTVQIIYDTPCTSLGVENIEQLLYPI